MRIGTRYIAFLIVWLFFATFIRAELSEDTWKQGSPEIREKIPPSLTNLFFVMGKNRDVTAYAGSYDLAKTTAKTPAGKEKFLADFWNGAVGRGFEVIEKKDVSLNGFTAMEGIFKVPNSGRRLLLLVCITKDRVVNLTVVANEGIDSEDPDVVSLVRELPIKQEDADEVAATENQRTAVKKAFALAVPIFALGVVLLCAFFFRSRRTCLPRLLGNKSVLFLPAACIYLWLAVLVLAAAQFKETFTGKSADCTAGDYLMAGYMCLAILLSILQFAVAVYDVAKNGESIFGGFSILRLFWHFVGSLFAILVLFLVFCFILFYPEVPI